MKTQTPIQTNLPPASLETRRHRAYSAKATNAEEFKCGVYSAHGSTHGQNKRHGFLKEFIEGPSTGSGHEKSRYTPPLSLELLQKGLREFQVRYSGPAIPATFSFLLGVSVPQAKRVVNLYALISCIFIVGLTTANFLF
jgi:hypothetical protein